MIRDRKQFFFEKKNQKTFASSPAPSNALFDMIAVVAAAKEQKFFASFFPKKKALPFFILASLCTPALAVSDPREMLKDPAQEARAEAVGSQLRCLVCQNTSIEDSDADLAKDLRAVVRQRVQAGDSDKQIMAWMVARYGNFVRLKPPLSWTTLLLWGMPVFALLVGGVAAFLGRRRAAPALAPLSAAEQSRLAELSRQA